MPLPCEVSPHKRWSPIRPLGRMRDPRLFVGIWRTIDGASYVSIGLVLVSPPDARKTLIKYQTSGIYDTASA
ncbi:hypothetical protein K435DRAFT_872791 [Dendrothele bispora CBS 962.96]|uniref:Uncharacterized protein n=1 Tax=Dendrothele bispora (strain CBS 962.96) TaxID=1314807 RepID=A0A4S8L0R2_DENBC|nr:hypothetical protein K435DRAFT_872791 [Dendrothele bispora CBS 962.96]